jgi:DNA primase
LRIDRGVIAEVLAKTDLMTLIGSHVALTRRGQHFIGLCPFHSERSPSFTVRQDRGFFKCFGCGVGGDAIRFVERIENVPFGEALRMLARQAGVTIAEETEYENKQRSLREAIAAANEIAANYFHRALLESPEAEKARNYCESRGLDAAALERFRIGYAPAGWNGLGDRLKADRVEDDVALQAGLLKQGQRGLYDFYRDRLMFPTTSITGEIVAFGGRSLDGSEPKYINTTTTPLYTKGKMLYGLQTARRSAGTTGAMIVVEGYLDCIAMQRAGFEHTVASLGTAFTVEQAELLRRYAGNVFVAYDGDAAGQGATDKALEILEKAELKARVVELDEGEDPDSFLRAHGSDAMRIALEKAPRASEYRIDRSLVRLQDGFRSASDIAAAVEPILMNEPPLERDRLRVRIAQKLGLSIEEVRRAVVPRRPPLRQEFARAAKPFVPAAGRDREILALLVEEPALIAEYRDRILPERLRDPRCRKLYQRFLAYETMESASDVLASVSEDPEIGEVLLALSGEERSSTVRFRNGAERRAHLDKVVAALTREDDERRRREIAGQIDALLSDGNPVPQELIDEQRAIQTRLARILRAGEK